MSIQNQTTTAYAHYVPQTILKIYKNLVYAVSFLMHLKKTKTTENYMEITNYG